MAFSREDLVAYEKSTAAPAPAASEPTPSPAPASVETPAPVAASSAAVDSDPAAPVEDASAAAPAESAPASADPDSATPDDGAAGEKPAHRGRAQERIEGLIDDTKSLRAYGEYMAQQNAALRAQLDEINAARTGKPAPAAAAPGASPTASVPHDADDPPPSLEASNFDPIAYSQEQTKWLQRQIDKGIERGLQRVKQTDTVATIKEQFESRAEAFGKANPDFFTVVANPALPPLAPAAVRNILQSENGPAIHYHLAKNPDKLLRISRMPPDQQLFHIGQIAAQVTAAPAPKPPPARTPAAPAQQPRSTTNAPPPPTPSPAGSSVQKDQSAMTMDEWVANDRARKIAERQARRNLRLSMR